MSIDLELYDRQIRTFGKDATIKLNSSSVLIIGLEKGLATEVAKNLALCGIKELYLYNDSSVIQEEDLKTGYYYSEENIGDLRANILTNKINELSLCCKSVDTIISTEVIICINQEKDTIIELNNKFRNNSKFISLTSSNNQGFIFVDAGIKPFTINNITGENYDPIQIVNISQSLIITTNGHEFQSGDTIKLINLDGENINELNQEFIIKVINKFNFQLISDIILTNYNFINGTVIYIDKPIYMKN